MSYRNILAICGAALLAAGALAQSPAPTVVQALPPITSAPASTGEAASAKASELAAAVKALQALKAANELLLQQQTATLQQLEEIVKAADQLRIQSARS